ARGRPAPGAAARGPSAAPPPAPPVRGAPPQVRPPGSEVTGTPVDQAPLIVAERRSNSLVIHARKPEMDLILQLVAKLDVDIYGGQRVFIYFVENSKAKDLAATLEAIYGRTGSARAAALPGGAPGAIPASTPAPPPVLPRVPAAGGGEIGANLTDLRFIA